jgi:hypothetical protein
MAFCTCNWGKSLSNFTAQFLFFHQNQFQNSTWVWETGRDQAGFGPPQVANCWSARPKAECHKYLPF